MTSQFALLNHHGVAVASDSNVSIGDRWKRTFVRTKIYQLAGRQPVGFMSCGRAAYLDIPLPVLFGEFREHFAQQNPNNAELDYLHEYVESFRNFISTYHAGHVTNSKNLTAGQQDEFEAELSHYLKGKFASLQAKEEWSSLVSSDTALYNFDWIGHKEKISGSLGLTGEGDKRATITIENTLAKNIKENLKKEILNSHKREKRTYATKSQTPENPHYRVSWETKKREMSRTYSHIVNPVVSRFIEEWGLPRTTTQPKLREILYYYLSDDSNIRHRTTITIFGFGKKEIKPSLIKLELGPWRPGRNCSVVTEYNKISILDIHKDKDKGWVDETESIPNIEYIGDVSYSSAFMCPIAQSAEIRTILTGIHPYLRLFTKYRMNLQNEAKELLEKQINERLNSFRTIVESLPIGELATFAETLMDLNSSIAYLSRASRGVGGPTTVATITKADGFLWVKSEESVDYTINPRQQVAPRHSAHLK